MIVNHSKIQKLSNHLHNAVPPSTPDRLFRFLHTVLHIDPTDAPLLEGHSTPFDYLQHAFFGPPSRDQPSDCLIWASRGAGKTFYAALATLLDLAFKPGIEIMILGGSLEQSARMHEHLAKLFEKPMLAQLLAVPITRRRVQLKNGSTARILAQSHASVRGTRPQILRCDEVELFDPDLWRAAQLVTRSRVCGRGAHAVSVRGTVEALSTCHRPGGLMSKLIADSESQTTRRLFKWTAIDVMEDCPPRRSCESCELWDECAGRAKQRTGTGHFLIDDAITMKRRSGKEAWESEMLCQRPMRRGTVFPEFNPAIHVFDSLPDLHTPATPFFIAGMDFGFRSPTVILWATVDESNIVRIIAERIESGVLLDDHVKSILNQGPDLQALKPSGPRAHLPILKWIGVDPAGSQRSDQTGLSPIAVLRRAGIVVKYRRSSIEDGLRSIRARLAPASGPPRLFIHSRCTRLIECLMNYRFPDDEQRMLPLKDGHDHAVDALRYMLVNLDVAAAVGVGRY